MLATGTLQTVDNQIDTTTGTIKLRAEFANADEKLFPNQFVNMRLRVQTLQNATVDPGGGRAARVVRHVRLRREARQHRRRSGASTLGPAEGERVAVTKG